MGEQRIEASRKISLFLLGFLTIVCLVADILISIKIRQLSDFCKCKQQMKNGIINCSDCSNDDVSLYNELMFVIYVIHIVTYQIHISNGMTIGWYRKGYCIMLIHLIFKVGMTIYWIIELGDEKNGHIDNYHNTIVYSILIMCFTTTMFIMLEIIGCIGYYIYYGTISFCVNLKIVCGCSEVESVKIEIEYPTAHRMLANRFDVCKV